MIRDSGSSNALEMKPAFQKPDRLGLFYRLIAGWYAIWFTVGLIFVSFNLPPLFGPIEDFLFIFLAAMVLLLDAIKRIGWLGAMLAFVWIALFSGAVETIGALTGFPFGSYDYTGAFGPRLFGLLPLAIPFAWCVVVFPLHILYLRLSQRNWVPPAAIPPMVGVSAAVVDLALEPVATLERGYWLWGGPGLWYGVPWTNFLGWFLTALILSAGLQWICGSVLRRGYGWESASAHMLPIVILLSIVFTFLLASIVAGYWLAALVALLVMLFLLRSLRHLGRFNLHTLW